MKKIFLGMMIIITIFLISTTVLINKSSNTLNLEEEYSLNTKLEMPLYYTIHSPTVEELRYTDLFFNKQKKANFYIIPISVRNPSEIQDFYIGTNSIGNLICQQIKNICDVGYDYDFPILELRNKITGEIIGTPMIDLLISKFTENINYVSIKDSGAPSDRNVFANSTTEIKYIVSATNVDTESINLSDLEIVVRNYTEDTYTVISAKN